MQEVEIDQNLIGMVESDSDSIELSKSITQLQSGSSGFAATSNESVTLYTWTDRGELEHAVTQSFTQEQIKFFAMNPAGREVLLLHPKSSQVSVFDGEFK